MKKVNIVLFKPPIPRWKILDSYLEVIESLHWALNDLGYDCKFYVNNIDRSCVNIVFGWTPAFLAGRINEFPPNTILYNLEQYSNTSMRGRNTLEMAAANFQVWDYSPANIVRWNELNPKFPVYYAKVSFAPNLIKLPHIEKEDIDIGYIGSFGVKRVEKLITVADTPSRHSLVSLLNVWGGLRDEFIARSKILLNISNEDPMLSIFEIVRVSYYLANKKAVICDLRPHMEIEEDMRAVLKLVEPSALGEACDQLLADDAARKNYAEACFEVFRQRDTRDVIKGFFF